MKNYKVKYIFSKNNYGSNVEKFGNENNILFITGLSGSGKTTLSNQLAEKFNAVILNLDCLGNYYSSKFDNTLIKDITKSFFESNSDIENIIKSGKYMNLKLNNFDYYIKYNNKYLNFIYNYCLNNKENSFIIEGTQLFMTINPTFFRDKSIIIIRKSVLKSLVRRLNRQLTIKEKLHPFSIGRKHIKKLLINSKRLHYKDVKKLNNFIYIIQSKYNSY